MIVKGYKVFFENWMCRNMQYSCPGIFTENLSKEELKLCWRGMHFSKNLIDCFVCTTYEFNPRTHVCEVEALGDVVESGDLCCTNKLRIIREIPWEEVLRLVNVGDDNTGFCNIGDFNSGKYNTGSDNSGNYNTGNSNSGLCNTGANNSGNFNSGTYNKGYYNSGQYNFGNNNAGDCNTGNYNSGDFNSGDFNSGDYNKADSCTGVFCTKSDTISFFNKPSDWTYKKWRNSKVCRILDTMPHEVMQYNDIDRQRWWNKLSQSDKGEILKLPNFDKSIFKEITGIDVEMSCEN